MRSCLTITHKSEAAGGIWLCLQYQEVMVRQGLGNEALPFLGLGATPWRMG
jgi:hypothetical protein